MVADRIHFQSCEVLSHVINSSEVCLLFIDRLYLLHHAEHVLNVNTLSLSIYRLTLFSLTPQSDTRLNTHLTLYITSVIGLLCLWYAGATCVITEVVYTEVEKETPGMYWNSIQMESQVRAERALKSSEG